MANSEIPPIRYLPNRLPRWSCGEMIRELPLGQYSYEIGPKKGLRPRLEAWFHDDRRRIYKFGGGAPIQPHPFLGLLQNLRRDVERITSEYLEEPTRFDSCFANLYRSGSDSISWHADDEQWVGPVITSVTLGAPRKFVMRPKARNPWEQVRVTFMLSHGDVLIMLPGCQEHWEHCVPKTKKSVGQRLNLTFRQTV